jgi:hypothetical protein
MALKDLAAELAKLSPQERDALKELLGGKEERPKPPPEVLRPVTTYHFKQVGRVRVNGVKMVDGKSVYEADALEDRYVSTSEKHASKLYWKQRNRYEYLGRSDGHVYVQAIRDGKRAEEAMELERKSATDKTPPPDNERTVLIRGRQFGWKEGMNQLGK